MTIGKTRPLPAGRVPGEWRDYRVGDGGVVRTRVLTGVGSGRELELLKRPGWLFHLCGRQVLSGGPVIVVTIPAGALLCG